MNKFRSRLLLGLVSVILSVLFGLGVLLGQLFQNFMRIPSMNGWRRRPSF